MDAQVVSAGRMLQEMAKILPGDKANLNIIRLRDKSIEDSANLHNPHVRAEETADGLPASPAQIEDVLADLQARAVHLEAS